MDSNSPPIELSERKPKDTDEGPNIATPDHVGAKTGQKEVPDEKISQVVPHDVLLRLQSQQQEEIEEVEEELFEDLDEDEPDCFHRNAAKIQKTLSAFYQDHKNIFLWSFYAVLILGYIVYFIYAMWYSFGDEGSIRLVVLTVFLVLMALAAILKPRLKNCVLPSVKRFDKSKLKYVRWAFYIIATLVIASIIIAEVAVKKPANLMSGVGIIVYVAVFFIFSHNPAKVKWRPVFMGLLLQFIFALIILRTESGFHSFMWLGDRVSEFLDHTNFGAEFVLGDATHHFFAFKILPIVIFFSTCISILYYWGAMQWIIFRVAWVMQVAMGTTAAESVNAAANIFIGQSEAPLMIRPLLPKMTNSELHAVMTGGFATIAGTVLGAFIGFGVPANHLLSASVISAPAALAMAKLFYPETKKSKTTVQDIENMEKG
ncbi:solute carrier family 28 member 3 [Lingula anatina]|uniref:Solute carrier family 28 member 3 n=1 Tax=Lingula anatina TaxID=7574 RepID=A0A1S3HU72_LINAN|nr:solute carrier family 28 member 3 [Lingula anatina]|eukprot:XP_013389091.1 solute carrier family 28 member 3 [Lingula anatina]